MTDDPTPARCFRCGGPADELNEIEEGETCPACAERLIESVGGVFHAPWAVKTAPAPAAAEEAAPAEPVRRSSRPSAEDDPGPRRA